MKKLLLLAGMFFLGLAAHAQRADVTYHFDTYVAYTSVKDSVLGKYKNATAVFYVQNEKPYVDFSIEGNKTTLIATKKLNKHDHPEGGFGEVYVTENVATNLELIVELEFDADDNLIKVDVRDNTDLLRMHVSDMVDN